MKISSRFSVAVHILSLLALEPNAHHTSEWMAGSVNTNPVVIRRVTSQLKKAGLVDVRPGTGGATLCKPASDIHLLDVYRAVEAVEEGELFGFHEHPNPKCPIGANIESVLQLVMLRAQSAMEKVLAEVTLDQLAGDLKDRMQEDA
ncbi:Rrf2 family transcriptional regulator [Paenibacillus alvei]|uniref:Rrf2 family transcriptional regulator n=1 Tax=Paenibacillus alvei TaxID=44250 RepID=A0AAP6ZVC0_PAEAL|nr:MULTISPECIES: Rrf2 family transcriptional regulator [Paenibacillus]EJW17198.1 putative HTH-type transcriptional regulator YwnA [Paenibacillus alvei DSM 29]MBG9737358.1 Rrf2 family transcriptional regulator [Paenibacillus alvei]MBG9746099.1 Rrf2 family transcriptional regulator [Paenibacillus alvei]MCY7483830.1 Rrf2 family transcriptional regulator [Paenibacillus alvei]MCY9541718.1 Rrf2 family transcriptional regulator [Paenibacillus alvei]